MAIARFRLAPSRPAALQFHLIHVELEQQLVGIDGDAVALLNQADSSTNSSFRGHVTYHQAIGCLLYTSPSPRD